MKKKKILSLILGILILFSFQTSLLAEDVSTGPTVTNISGPTSGMVGETYTFSTNVSSVAGYPIADVFLAQTTNAETSSQDTYFAAYSVGDIPECTSLDCSISGQFSPSSTGTYYIYLTVNYEGTSCNTHPSETESNCLDSRGEYITFIVEDDSGEEALPETATIPTRTYLLIISGFLLILSSFVVQNISLSSLEKRKREKFENKFE